MKGGLAAVLGAAAALRQTPGDLWIGFVADEEYASIGADAFVRAAPPMACVLVEPTDEEACIAHKAFAWLTVTTEGRAAHGSLPDQGIDAIAHMGRLLGAMEGWREGIFVAQRDPLLGPPSVHASLIDGGLGWSTYPDRCALKVEHRMLPEQTAQHALALWSDAIARQSAADPRFMARAELDLFRPGYRIADDAPITRALQQAVTVAAGSPARIRGIPAWMDSAVLSAAGFPTIIYGPRGAGAHAATEYVELDSVFRCAEVYAALIAAWR
jgi:acetylornithine deacetylase